MNIKTFIDKSNTIIYNSNVNTSQNPVSQLFYGNGFSRFLLHFDLTHILSLVSDKTMIDYTKVKHILKIKNAWGLEKTNFDTNKQKERASGVTIYLLKLNQEWTEGCGRDNINDIYISNNKVISEDGSNWFNSSTENAWEIPMSGLTSDNTQYIVGQQTLEHGNEDIEIDITNEINSTLSGNTQNYGYMFCFDHKIEETSTQKEPYVSLITNKTTSIYKPYLETTIDCEINDDRFNFYLDKTNKLYFYSIIGGDFKNLDSIPTCVINDTPQVVHQQTKGVYYVEISLKQDNHQPETIMYDTWSNIVYDGVQFDDVEMEFVTLDKNQYFKFGNGKIQNERFVPTVYGIKNGEKIHMGEIKRVFIQPRLEYTTNNIKNIDDIEYKIYTKNGTDEITYTQYNKVNRMPDSNYFTINTNYMLYGRYFVDIKIKRNGENILFKEKLSFDVI